MGFVRQLGDILDLWDKQEMCGILDRDVEYMGSA